MAENDGGGRRPPPPPGYRSLAKPPPPPSARGNTPLPIRATEASSGQKPAPEQPATKSLKEMLGLEAYSHVLQLLRNLCRCLGLTMADFKTLGPTLIFQRSEIACAENGELHIPLTAFGEEGQVYRTLYGSLKPREIPGGLFFRVSAQGPELSYPPQAQSELPCTLPDAMALEIRKVLGIISDVDEALSGKLGIEGDSVFIKKGEEKCELASATTAGGRKELRIYFEDLGWGDEPECSPASTDKNAIRFDGIQPPSEDGPGGQLLTKKAARCKAVLHGFSTARMVLFTMHKHIFFRITENEASVCASNSRDGPPSASSFLHVQ